MLNELSQPKPYTGEAHVNACFICFQARWWELDNCFKNSEGTVKIENYCFLSWPNIKHSAHLMTLRLPRGGTLWTIKSQQTCTVWVWRSHYRLTDPIQFTSSMDSTWSENRQAAVVNGTPTVKPASHSSSGKEKDAQFMISSFQLATPGALAHTHTCSESVHPSPGTCFIPGPTLMSLVLCLTFRKPCRWCWAKCLNVDGTDWASQLLFS